MDNNMKVKGRDAMTVEERYKITSNDFIDIIIGYNLQSLERYQDYTIQRLNNSFSVVFYPVSEINTFSSSILQASSIPRCYGLESAKSLEASSVTRVRSSPALGLRGQGVLVGIVDTGIDYTHPAFIREDGSSKILSIWDQTIDSEDMFPPGSFLGTEYLQDQINQALQSPDPRSIVPSTDELGHGTCLAGIAAGRVIGDFSGVSPDSDLVVVKLKQAKSVIRNFYALPEGVPCYQENDIILGVQYLVNVARRLNRPMAINISLGTSQGAHDGRGYLSYVISLLSDFPGISICVSAGNEGNRRRHFYASNLTNNQSTLVQLEVATDENNFSIELWGSAPSTYSIDITTPTGEFVPRIAESLRSSKDITFDFESTRLVIDYFMVEPQIGDQLILVRFYNPAPGSWSINVYSRGDIPGSFHIWLPMGDFISRDTYFLQSNPYTTVTSPGNSNIPITITAYNPETNVLYQNASRGYARTGEVKPDLAAPGVNLLGPDLNKGYTRYTGTGAATAHTTGITALMLEWGIIRGNYTGMDTVEIKKFLIRGARRGERLVYPNREWGYGTVDIYNTFNILRQLEI